MHKLSNRQRRIVGAINLYIKAHGYPPAIREIGKMVDLASPATVTGHLVRLRKAGYIAWEEGRPRTIQSLQNEKTA
ncbi:transcriptional regulator [Bacillus sp. V33-4]|uniref:LexA family protein n=1 Tax=Bacillus sp. V33-4 TaxID=2054169 RepID=UPI000C7829D2|nr:transcriptional regulator [Bacillus sp. V33-4]PLR86189.1 transcriptional regulator [Bacillus sp. V33-4]